LELVPEGARDRLASDFIDYNEDGFLAGEEDERNVAHKDRHEGDLADIGLPETLRGVITLARITDIE